MIKKGLAENTMSLRLEGSCVLVAAGWKVETSTTQGRVVEGVRNAPERDLSLPKNHLGWRGKGIRAIAGADLWEALRICV